VRPNHEAEHMSSASPLITDIGYVSTQRQKQDSNVGFANRDFTSLFLKKFEAQGRFEPTQNCPM